MGRLRNREQRDQLLSPREVENLIAEGKTVIIVDGKVLRVDAWLPYHPGGQTSIKHMVGRDATDEVNGFHSPEAKQRMYSYQIGRIEGPWTNFLPPIQGGKFRRLNDLDKEQEVENKGHSDDDSQHSLDPSPTFDPADCPASTLRSRNHGLDRSSSASSISSVDLDDDIIKPRLSHFDARTQKEIDLDKAKYPSLDAATQAAIVEKYRLLNLQIEAEGLYQCRYYSYAIEALRYSLLFAGFLYFLRKEWYALSALFLGIFWHQLAFTAHDAGHCGITHGFHTDSVIGILVADFCGGLSLGWWKRSHNVHHVVTNSAEHDPDIQHMPFFAISHQFFDSLFSTYHNRVLTYDRAAQFFIQIQHFLYYPILAFGRFNLYVQSWIYLLGGQAPRRGPAWWHLWLEFAGQAFFWTWFGYLVVYRSVHGGWNRALFVMICHAVTMPLHVQITLSHFAMSTADLGPRESFPQKMLRTTMDVDCPQWLDFFHGGLQFQAIHHLYPRIPRHNLRRTQKLVQGFCEDVEIPYALYGFVDGNRTVIGKLGDVARQAAILAECRKSISDGGIWAH
ncbi:delta 6-fatty acid desaturase [Pseudovirgaria hyperparasitica]|uniref:Delta 8-(E)-sphingolipid desaturase n=1 Tax=Pseudovirgaria hyperparasitica TaxID=470096 RepID=A0A6A6VZS8_9PEZI|nr:delta 6-fatty acid desaturase [Pseudovirgaria hyperparasitica]KAF2755793.1 delta 6-fatty acid desaturase [Pseudovirgaria hyperparasitica]